MRHLLIGMREDRGLSREALAHSIGVNVRTVHRWESGERRPQAAQRVKLAEAYDRPLADVLRALDVVDDEPINGQRVPATLTMLASLEQGATEMRWFEPLAVPGLLQTADYAAAVERTSLACTEADVARRVEFRLRRQRAVLREREPLRLYALLDGSVLLRDTGGEAVMAAQLDHLRAMDERENVEVRVAPLDCRVFTAPPGAFQLLSGDGGRPYVACTENLAGVQYLESSSVVSAYSDLFGRLWRDGHGLEEVELLNGERFLRRGRDA